MPRTSRQGDAKAQSDLGHKYFHGNGVPQDYAEAVRWYRKAAKQGNEYARRALGSMKVRFTTRSKINLAVIFLGKCIVLDKFQGSIRNRQQRRATLAGRLGLLWVGLDVYGRSGCSNIRVAGLWVGAA